MSKKCNIISFGKSDKMFIVFIVVGAIISTILLVYRIALYVDKLDKHPIILSFWLSSAIILFFILLIIYKIMNRRRKRGITISSNERQFILGIKHLKQVTKFQKFLWILLSSFINYISNILDILFCLKVNYFSDFNSWLLDILSLSFFSHFILNTKLYKHHYFSIIIITIIGSIDLVLDIIYVSGKDAVISNLVNYAIHILVNLIYILYKYYMNVKLISYYEILTFEGIIEILFEL